MTEKEFQNLFDSIRCSESFTAHMEELLSVPPASGFAETASGVSVARPRRHWMRWAGLAACLLLTVGGAAVLLQREQVPPEYPVATDQETVLTEQSAVGSETQTETKQSTETADSTETQSVTEAFIVTQTISDTSVPEEESIPETTAPQTEAEWSVMSDPTMPPETETQPGTSAAAETTTTFTSTQQTTLPTTTSLSTTTTTSSSSMTTTSYEWGWWYSTTLTETTAMIHYDYAGVIEYDDSPMKIGETRAIHYYHPAHPDTPVNANIIYVPTKVTYEIDTANNMIYVTAIAAGEESLYISVQGCVFGVYADLTIVE